MVFGSITSLYCTDDDRMTLLSALWDFISLRWRHNGRDCISNHQPHHCLLNRLFRPRSKKTSKLSVTGLCEGNSPGTGEFPASMASNAENVSIWWHHHLLQRWHLHTAKVPGNSIVICNYHVSDSETKPSVCPSNSHTFLENWTSFVPIWLKTFTASIRQDWQCLWIIYEAIGQRLDVKFHSLLTWLPRSVTRLYWLGLCWHKSVIEADNEDIQWKTMHCFI